MGQEFLVIIPAQTLEIIPQSRQMSHMSMKKNPKSIHKHLGVWACITRIMFDTSIIYVSISVDINESCFFKYIF